MPPFEAPTFYPAQKIVSYAVVCRDRACIAAWRRQIIKAVLWSKEGSILIKIGSCDKDRKKVDSGVTQEALNELRDELGLLGIATNIITGEIDLSTQKCPVYLFASIHNIETASQIHKQLL